VQSCDRQTTDRQTVIKNLLAISRIAYTARSNFA